ncbi:HEAT repeat protein-like protein [Bisporella sp. PMI_857]|nr:HEAT repeat protein-like protein [Bisporella sp. PMI_857]
MPDKSGRIVKSRRVKKGTDHQKNHRWESFTSKVSKLNSLAPIRKVRRHDIDEEDLSTTTSYLRTSLEKWQELNTSQDFLTLNHELLSLCDSLPQILHFENKIMGILVRYIENYISEQEKSALETVLDLVTEFAHDLGARFEKHYARTLQLVTAVAVIPGDVEVIEWSFTCIAFLFKYLSKLLVPDLRPTYDLMAPLLGKQRQQPHIARFAAEAMSFLIKKAAAPGNRESALPLIVGHAKKDLQSSWGSRQYGLYYHGIMTMFAEGMKGNGLNVHTTGTTVFRELFMALNGEDLSSEAPSPWANVTCGVLTSIIHHTCSNTFKDILNMLLELMSSSQDMFVAQKSVHDFRRLLLCTRMTGIVAGVRQGSRINNWQSYLETTVQSLQSISKEADVVSNYEPVVDLWQWLVLSVGIIIQYAPMEAIIPFGSKFMEFLTKEPLEKYFLTFCSYLSESEPARFSSIVKPYFQKFVVAHWSDSNNGDTLCVLLPKMASSGVLPENNGKPDFNLPQSWQAQIVSKFEGLEVKPFPEQVSAALYDPDPKKWVDRCLPKYNGLLDVLQCTSVRPSTNARIAEILLRKLKLALRPEFSAAPEEAHFIVGRGFSAILRMISGTGQIEKSLEPLLYAKVPDYGQLPDFLQALLVYEKGLSEPRTSITATSKTDAAAELDSVVSTLVANLSTESKHLRLLSLRLLEHFYNMKHGSSSEALSLMVRIEETPLNLESSRVASMCIRKLALLYGGVGESSWIKSAIPSFCFGMFTVKFAQIWEDASATLKQISQSSEGENLVAELAFSWLESPSWKGSPQHIDEPSTLGLTDFECSNLMRLHQLASDSASRIRKSRDIMLENFAAAQQLVDPLPSSARSHALRVFTAAPSLAERRSKRFVPMFLSWADRDSYIEKPGEGNDEQQPGNLIVDWSRKDQKSQLALMSLFTNSRSLYKADEVYRALLHLLENGDLETQKSALKAIFTWKNPSIKPYEENLLNLLDEARFKDEISVLLHHQTGEIATLQSQTLVQAEHRSELNSVLLRLLYGRSVSRRGVASGRQGPETRRLAILRNLGLTEFGQFLDIALGPLKGNKLFIDNQLQESSLNSQILSVEKQIGLTNMIEAILKELGTNVESFTEMITDAILYCLINSCRIIKKESSDDSDDSSDTSEALPTPEQSKLTKFKAVRQAGLKCLNLLFANSGDGFDWTPYIGAIIQNVVLPRLDNLPIESAEGVSGILRLFYTWSASLRMSLFFNHNKLILPKIAECLVPSKSKDEVKLFVLTIIRNLAKIASDQLGLHVRNTILNPNIDHFLTQIGVVLRNKADISKSLLENCVETVSDLAPLVTNSTQAHSLVDVSIFLLDQPSKRVSPKTKSGLLRILEHFVPLYDLQNDEALKDTLYTTITRLFGFFTDRASREVLSRVLMVYSSKDPVINEVAELCIALNSFGEGSKARLGEGGNNEPDWDRRIKAFEHIQAPREVPFTARQWTPLLYNMLFYIRDEEYHSVLSINSSESIRHFINSSAVSELEDEQTALSAMLSAILIPALLKGAREQSEHVRGEFVRVMGHLVKTYPAWSEVNDMHSLLAGEDELEASFFNNILTVGKGRQSSALAQLSSAAERGELNSKNVSHFFIPLVEHFILDRQEGSDGHNLAAEATLVLGVLAKSLEWPQYRAMLRRFIGYIEEKPELTRHIIKLLAKVTDALSSAAQEASPVHIDAAPKKRCELSRTMPKDLKLAGDITNGILPKLTSYLHDKDESTVSLRVPVAVIIVRLLKLLPQEQLNELLPPVLTDICHILRSKAQEARDMARDTLTKICVLLGPSCFGFVLKELRSALARGSQLHILSYTMHTILVACTPEYSPGDLDYCLPSIVAIIMDDIFGATGQEKDAEEYHSKMKEVKSSKSQDSMELIAKTATLSRLAVLVKPIQALLNEKLNLKMVRKIDELLNRISTGLLMNSAASSRDSLVFCYEVIKDFYDSKTPEAKVKISYKLRKYLIQPGAKKTDRGTTTVYTYKLVRFAFDVLRVVLKKHEQLQTVTNLAGFVPILEDAIAEGEEEVKTSTFRLLTTIIKRIRLKSDDNGTSVYSRGVSEAIRSIKGSSSTTSEISQSALKLISVVLREHLQIPVKDKAIDDILIILKEDMTEPERRHVTFNFLRAVLDSKVQTAVVYDTLDYIGTVMITNADNETRKLARGAYLQFLRDYPQHKRRWEKQLNFIIDNLNYKGEGGRLSILEVILLLLTKSSGDEYVQEISTKCFRPLILVYNNDESEKCKRVAAEIIKEVFKRADEEHLPSHLAYIRSWVKISDEPSELDLYRRGLALNIYGFYYECQGGDDGGMARDENDLPMLLNSITEILESVESPELRWNQLFAALELANVIALTFPELAISSSTKFWLFVPQCLSYPHAMVKLSAARLLGSYSADFARANQTGIYDLPLEGSSGLKLTGDMVNALIRRFANVLNTPELPEELAQQTYKNLVFLGLVAGASNLIFKGPELEESGDEEEADLHEKRSSLQYLFSRLGYILRKETFPARAPTLVPKISALTLLEALTLRLDTKILLPCIHTILLPLHNLTDPSIPVPYSIDELFKTNYEALRQTAEGLMESLKQKIGTKNYSEATLEVRKSVAARRNQRSSKRKIEAISMPERHGLQKKKKVERKKERRKEKGQEHSIRRKEY